MAAEDRKDTPLRARRKELQLLQREVAVKANCAESLVSMAEKGYVPGLGSQHRIADALSASVGIRPTDCESYVDLVRSVRIFDLGEGEQDCPSRVRLSC